MSITSTPTHGCGVHGIIPTHGAIIVPIRPTITVLGGDRHGTTHGVMTHIGDLRGVPAIIPVTILTTIPIILSRAMLPHLHTVQQDRAHIVLLAPVATMVMAAELVPVQAAAMANIAVNAQVRVVTAATTTVIAHHHHAATNATHR